jgi:hypothetical protein
MPKPAAALRALHRGETLPSRGLSKCARIDSGLGAPWQHGVRGRSGD